MSGLGETLSSIFYRIAVSGALPVSWFRDVDPATIEKAKKTGKLRLEIVSHCWRYGHFLTYQLSSLVNHRTDKLDITMTVFHVADDEAVTPVLDYFGRMEVLLPEDDEILVKGRSGPNVLDIPIDRFEPCGDSPDKAKGAYQITHGDIARACGYCDSIKYYQTPAERWMKTYEDRAFRWLIGTQGTPLDIPNVCQIRHIVKGRYRKDSTVTEIRKFIRKRQDR